MKRRSNNLFPMSAKIILRWFVLNETIHFNVEHAFDKIKWIIYCICKVSACVYMYVIEYCIFWDVI